MIRGIKRRLLPGTAGNKEGAADAALRLKHNVRKDASVMAPRHKARQRARYSEEFLTLYAKVFPLFSVVPFLIVPP